MQGHFLYWVNGERDIWEQLKGLLFLKCLGHTILPELQKRLWDSEVMAALFFHLSSREEELFLILLVQPCSDILIFLKFSWAKWGQQQCFLMSRGTWWGVLSSFFLGMWISLLLGFPFFRGLGKEKPMSLHSSRGYVFWHMILEAGGEPWQICSCCMCRMVFSLSQRAQGTWQRCFGLSCESPEGRCGFPVMQLMEKQKCCCWGLAGVGAALPSCCDSA